MKNIFLFILISLLFACSGPSSFELIETKKEDAVAKFEQFYMCYDIAKKTPVITEDFVNWSSDVEPKVRYKESNVYQIGIESFKDLSKPLDIHYDGTRRREHADMANLFNIDLSKHEEPHNYSMDEKYSYQKPSESGDDPCANAIHHFLNSRYLLINRISDHQEAVLQTKETFKEGNASGDVLIFDLEKQELIGGFMVHAQSQKQISIHETSDYNANLRADLEMNITGKIKEKFKKMAPGIDQSRSFTF